MPKPTITEDALAEQLGLPRGEIKALRKKHLREQHDWFLDPEKNRALTLTEDAANTIRRLLDIPAAPVKKDAPERTELTVERVAPGNRRIVLCLTEKGAGARLRVRDNANFLPGMVVTNCVHEEADRYCYEGRLPRRRGRF